MPNSEFPKEVLLMTNERIQTRIPIEYEWVLVPALCGVIGHKPEHCKAAKEKAKQKTSSKAKQGSPSVSRPQAALDVQGLAQALHTLPPPGIFASPGTSPNGICSTRSLGESCPSCKSAKFHLPTHVGLCSSAPTRVLSA
ncbi:hypothetical protein Salat_2358100 [Sesamum alatum]|uniref:Uncharacterized protein n=1 Tax=Sesamum alatum TaxID=300844 RepID=A0AAE1XWX2_9LAMI|nr:hypothetical protein Salat_2358100 [Sesamum alatum]